MKKHLFQLTPLGKADLEVREYLKDNLDEEQFERYEFALDNYRHMKMVQTSLQVLLYASIITSVAATFGLNQAQIIQKVASYIGLSVIFVLYAITSYIAMIRRESYHVQREILLSKAGQDDN
ncbi:MAG: hypothetical protein ABEI58_02155 [Candidatus Nanohaloarchaea archaeon]